MKLDTDLATNSNDFFFFFLQVWDVYIYPHVLSWLTWKDSMQRRNSLNAAFTQVNKTKPLKMSVHDHNTADTSACRRVAAWQGDSSNRRLRLNRATHGISTTQDLPSYSVFIFKARTRVTPHAASVKLIVPVTVTGDHKCFFHGKTAEQISAALTIWSGFSNVRRHQARAQLGSLPAITGELTARRLSFP